MTARKLNWRDFLKDLRRAEPTIWITALLAAVVILLLSLAD